MSNPTDGVYAFVGLFPVMRTADHLAFRKLLRELDRQGSPFIAVRNVHRARLVIIDEAFFEGTPAAVDRFASRYLLFACDFDGSNSDDLARVLAMHAPEEVRKIWGYYCIGCPNMDDTVKRVGELSSYFRKCELGVNFFFSAQLDRPASEQDASVSGILRALELKRRFADFAAAHQFTPPADLRAEFQEFWRTYQTDMNVFVP